MIVFIVRNFEGFDSFNSEGKVFNEVDVFKDSYGGSSLKLNKKSLVNIGRMEACGASGRGSIPRYRPFNYNIVVKTERFIYELCFLINKAIKMIKSDCIHC